MSVQRISVGNMGTNCYIYRDEGTGRCAVIDPGAMDKRLRAAINDVGADSFDYILLTHCHFDHVGGVAQVKALTGAVVAIHEDDYDGLADPNLNVSACFGMGVKFDLADKKLKDGEIISVGDTKFRVMHTPGHSEGSCCFVTDGIIFTGDTLFRESMGRFDMPGGSYDKVRSSLRRLASLDGDYRLYPGHDEISTLSYERKYNPCIDL